jgi:orotate phosphoribosyltransferase-like protein
MSEIEQDYDSRAIEHRPQTIDEMRCACHELASRGYTDGAIASATGLSTEAVRRLIGERRT